KATAPPPQIKTDPFYNPFKSTPSSEQAKNISTPSWEEYYKIFQQSAVIPSQDEQTQLDIPASYTPVECFQWLNKYIVCILNENLLIIDQHRAHEKIIYEKLKLSSQNIASQTLLFPLHIDL